MAASSPQQRGQGFMQGHQPHAPSPMTQQKHHQPPPPPAGPHPQANGEISRVFALDIRVCCDANNLWLQVSWHLVYRTLSNAFLAAICLIRLPSAMCTGQGVGIMRACVEFAAVWHL